MSVTRTPASQSPSATPQPPYATRTTTSQPPLQLTKSKHYTIEASLHNAFISCPKKPLILPWLLLYCIINIFRTLYQHKLINI
ncbi:hypothetical protein Hanom_Chr12g01118151 [Helianthus anomalus]